MVVRAAWLIIIIATIETSAAFVLGYSSLAQGSMLAAGQWLLETAVANALPVILIVIGGVIAMRIVRFSVPRLVESNIRARAQVGLEDEVQKNIRTLSDVIVGTLKGRHRVTDGIPVDGSDWGRSCATACRGGRAGGGSRVRGAEPDSGRAGRHIHHAGESVPGWRCSENRGIGGLVEDINLRRTLLRDLDYRQHTIPNGTITTTTNYTKDKSRVNINIGVAYKTDLEQAFEVLNRVGQELTNDEEWGPIILDPIKALRVDNFGDSGIEIKVLGEVLPIRQWDVAGEYRLRVKRAFDVEGIEIPFPHRTLFFGDTTPETLAIRGAIMGRAAGDDTDRDTGRRGVRGGAPGIAGRFHALNPWQSHPSSIGQR